MTEGDILLLIGVGVGRAQPDLSVAPVEEHALTVAEGAEQLGGNMKRYVRVRMSKERVILITYVIIGTVSQDERSPVSVPRREGGKRLTKVFLS